VAWYQNHWDDFSRFSLKIGGDNFSWFDLKIRCDGFSKFDLKTGGDGVSGLGLETGGYSLVIWALKSLRRFFGLSLKTK
jgi:hypothetical protein